jgi:hypothetical protein
MVGSLGRLALDMNYRQDRNYYPRGTSSQAASSENQRHQTDPSSQSSSNNQKKPKIESSSQSSSSDQEKPPN